MSYLTFLKREMNFSIEVFVMTRIGQDLALLDCGHLIQFRRIMMSPTNIEKSCERKSRHQIEPKTIPWKEGRTVDSLPNVHIDSVHFETEIRGS